jgi:hypothetical protein
VTNLSSAAAIFVLLGVLASAGTSGGPNGDVELFGVRLPGLCMFRNITGRPCPGCGLTRGLVAGMHGDLAGAGRLHPSAVGILAWLSIQLVARVLLAIPRIRSRRIRLVDIVISGFSYVLVAYLPMIAANLSGSG